MSPIDEIQSLLASNQLRHLTPTRLGQAVVRDVFVNDDVFNLLDENGTLESRFERVAGRARSKIDAFISGSTVTFALDPHEKNRTSFLARNAPIAMGIVDVRITDPKPMIRIFGGFAAKNALVLLSWAPRDGLEFQKEVIQCRAKWNKLFNNKAPLIGTTHDEYLSGNFDIG